MSSSSSNSQSELVFRSFPQLQAVESKKNMLDILTNPKGANIFDRYNPALEYLKARQSDGLATEERGLLSSIDPQIIASDQYSNSYYGSNFASNNYLGLSKHPSTIQAATQAANTFGVNSAGSPLAFGATKYYMQLKEEIGEYLQSKALIYSSGWLSAYGTVKSLIKQSDYVIIDEFSDNPFFDGAYASTKNVIKNRHLDEKHIEQILKGIRSKDTQNGILIITESIFPLDSASPNIVNLQKIAKNYQAYIALGIGYDFGIVGPNGKGVWEEQGLKDRSNIIFVGTGSKTTSINYGFIAISHQHAHVPEYMKYFSAAYMFTNAINPVQANSALATLRIIRSQQGANLRKELFSNCQYLRSQLQKKGFNPLGRESGFVCVTVGDEIVSRIVVRMLMDNQIHVNNIEYPMAPLGKAVVRFSLSPNHTHDQIDKLVKTFEIIFKKAKQTKQHLGKKLNAKL